MPACMPACLPTGRATRMWVRPTTRLSTSAATTSSSRPPSVTSVRARLTTSGCLHSHKGEKVRSASICQAQVCPGQSGGLRNQVKGLDQNAMIVMCWWYCLQARCPRRPGGSRWVTRLGSPPRRPWACPWCWPSCCPCWWPGCYNPGVTRWWWDIDITQNLRRCEVFSDIKKLNSEQWHSQKKAQNMILSTFYMCNYKKKLVSKDQSVPNRRMTYVTHSLLFCTFVDDYTFSIKNKSIFLWFWWSLSINIVEMLLEWTCRDWHSLSFRRNL